MGSSPNTVRASRSSPAPCGTGLDLSHSSVFRSVSGQWMGLIFGSHSGFDLRAVAAWARQEVGAGPMGLG
jgi:hypothetical protein